MQYLMKSLCATSMLALVAGCATPEVDKLESTPASGNAFNKQLTEEYKVLAKFEAKDMKDFIDAGHFAEKGMKAARNEETAPDEVWSRDLPKGYVAQLTDARERLMEAFANGVKDNHPVDAAVAQAKYDCWLEQQEENYQPEHIAACRGAFMTALRSIYSKERARLDSQRQVADASRTADRVAAKPLSPSDPETMIFFDFDKATIPDSEKAKLDDLVASANVTNEPFTLVAVGHADRAGGYDYNKSLSVRRAEAVREALLGRGLKPSVVVVEGKGETEPLKPTADGVREPDNRRVRVIVR